MHSVVGSRTFQAHHKGKPLGNPSSTALKALKSGQDALPNKGAKKERLVVKKKERFEVRSEDDKRVGHAHDTSNAAKKAAHAAENPPKKTQAATPEGAA